MTPQLMADVKTNALMLRGKSLLQLGRKAASRDEALKYVASARADFEAARQSAPNSPLPYVNLADAAGAENKAEEAEQQLERALSIDHTNFQALTALINLGTATGRLDEVRSPTSPTTATG